MDKGIFLGLNTLYTDPQRYFMHQDDYLNGCRYTNPLFTKEELNSHLKKHSTLKDGSKLTIYNGVSSDRKDILCIDGVIPISSEEFVSIISELESKVDSAA